MSFCKDRPTALVFWLLIFLTHATSASAACLVRSLESLLLGSGLESYWVKFGVRWGLSAVTAYPFPQVETSGNVSDLIGKTLVAISKDSESSVVYADRLQEQGCSYGEFLILHSEAAKAHAAGHWGRFKKLMTEARALFERDGASWLPTGAGVWISEVLIDESGIIRGFNVKVDIARRGSAFAEELSKMENELASIYRKYAMTALEISGSGRGSDETWDRIYRILRTLIRGEIPIKSLFVSAHAVPGDSLLKLIHENPVTFSGIKELELPGLPLSFERIAFLPRSLARLSIGSGYTAPDRVVPLDRRTIEALALRLPKIEVLTLDGGVPANHLSVLEPLLELASLKELDVNGYDPSSGTEAWLFMQTHPRWEKSPYETGAVFRIRRVDP